MLIKTPVAYLTKEINPTKPLLNFMGDLAELGLTLRIK